MVWLEKKVRGPRLALVWAILLAGSRVGLAGADEDSDSEPDRDEAHLPSLWTAAMSGSYHVLYQLTMKDSVQLVEEWAAFSQRLFRLDLVGADGARTSFVTNGHTREMFRYRPFVCAHSDGTKLFKDLGLIAPMFIGHVWDDHGKPGDAYFAYGLGPLWLRAYRDGREVAPANGSRAELPFEGDFEVHEVEFEPEVTHTQQPFRLRFYFPRAGRGEFVDTVDWFLQDGDRRGPGVHQVRAKVISVDYRYAVDESVFKLPVGYGCSRRLEFDPSLQVDVGLVLLHQGGPNQATFNVIASFPNDDSLQAASWTHQKYSFRAVRVSQPRADSPVKTESYFATLTQSREAPDGQRADPVVGLAGVPQSRLRRVKRVWWAPDSSEGQAVVYTIDQATGECAVSHQDARNQVLLSFGAGPRLAEDKQPALSLDQLSVLFDDFAGFHLIDEGESFGEPAGNRFRDRFYEKRLDKFQLKSGDGEAVWSGPVSIVKQISTYSRFLEDGGPAGDEPQKPQLKLAQDYRLKLILFFYSERLDRVLFKLVIELLDNREVSFGYATRQLDVSQCFPPGDRRDVVVKYPLESVALSRQLEHKRELIELLAGSALLWGRGRVLTPLQVANIRPSVDPFFLRLEMSLLDVPLTHTFRLQRGLKLQADPLLGWSEADKVLIELGASSAELCGQHCEFYNCFAFSFDSKARLCRVALDHLRTQPTQWSSSDLYAYVDRRLPADASPDARPSTLALVTHKQPHERPHLSADAIVGLLEELVVEAQDEAVSGLAPPVGGRDADAPSPLTLRVPLNPAADSLRNPLEAEQVVVLRPSALEHNLETMNEYSRELDESGAGGEVRVRGGRQLRLEFLALLHDRTFAKYTGETLSGLTYEQCEQHCERNDCRSFAYCLWNESCQVSGQHREKFLTANSRLVPADRQCNIHVLNYLSKFEPYGRVPRPAADQVSATEPATSPSDCATSCMDHQGFACQGFYFCTPPPVTPANPTLVPPVCLLTKRPAETLELGEREAGPQPLVSLDDGAGAADVARECAFYARSYLAQFDKYLGRQINLEGASQRLTTVGSLQDCLRHCLRSKCLAFDACPSARGPNSGLFGGQTCHMVVDSIRRDQLVADRRCTTFVLADKSYFNSQNLALVYGNATGGGRAPVSNRQALGAPDQEASIAGDDENAAPAAAPDRSVADEAAARLQLLEGYERDLRRDHPRRAGHRWLAGLGSLSLGVLLGFGFVLAWDAAYARGWLSRRRSSLRTPLTLD